VTDRVKRVDCFHTEVNRHVRQMNFKDVACSLKCE